MSPRVCAVILNYNGKEKLDAFLKSFPKTDYPDYKVVVVDNGSTDGSEKMVRESYPWADLLRLEENRGFSGGNNDGIRYAFGKYAPAYVILLNNDMEVCDRNWMGEMIRAAEATPGAGVIGCKLLSDGNRIQHAGGKFSLSRESFHPAEGEPDDGSHDLVHDADYITGACLMISRAALLKAGLLDERYNPIYFEDAEYCCRARRAGFRIIYDGKASLMHYHDRGRTPQAVLWRQMGYYSGWTKNRIRFVLLNLPPWWLPILIPRIFAVAVIGRDEQGRLGIMPSPLARLGVVFSGILSALGGRPPVFRPLEAPPAKEF
ncbi:MAG TPA: glycosyltransferase family 2 protein [Candidatus Bilamarchaeum sp.]|nr:glycosyltransferase family 2 protein [Candidatus Bilamarchaeum sp.]